MSKQKIVNFLKNFPNAKIVYNQDPSKKVSPMIYALNVDDAIKKNTNGSDLYFYINGASKDSLVTSFNACFIDLDAGRDEDGEYFDMKIVNRSKAQMLKRLSDFPLVPSFVVETRNGFQIYWLFQKPEKNCAITWKGAQSRIVTFFKDVGADRRTIKPSQLYRVPHSLWNKKTEGKKSFLCDIKISTKNKYTLQEIKDAIVNLKISSIKRVDSESTQGNNTISGAPVSYNSKTKWSQPPRDYGKSPVNRTVN